MDSWLLGTKPCIHTEINTASSKRRVNQKEWLHVENVNGSILKILHKSQLKTDHRPQHKNTYTEPDMRESGLALNSLAQKKIF